MLLKLPPSLQYPITITKIHKRVGDDVVFNDTLFDYTFKVKVPWGSRDSDEEEWREETHGSKFESSVEGKLKLWRVWETDVIYSPREIVEVEEPCPHDIQVNGMCAMCGKDMTLFNSYNSEVTDSERAPIRMSHDTQALTVSEQEATRVEDAAKRRLLASKKLSLVVDLDQTIIHAAVDPTIAEWQKDRDNPNYEAVKDVRAFQLIDDGPGMRGCWYYIKLRPGLMDFLERISKLYELHIYTMGTRQYAQQIAKIVDPTRKYFGDRILSRDESGSMTAKSLQRLFPVDTKMVVIIDDRGDVWKWSDNLVKVAPFDFFVGIGDINSSFLPKKQEIQPGPEPKTEEPAPSDNRSNGATDSAASTNGTDVSALEQLVAMGGGDDPAVREMQTSKQEEAISSQVADKPLLQMQKRLDEEDEAAAAAEEAASSTSSSDDGEKDSSNANGHVTELDEVPPSPDESTLFKTSSTTSSAHQRHSLLNNDDKELTFLERSLKNVHSAFYSEYDRRRLSNKGGRVATLAGKRKLPLAPQDSESTPNDLVLVPDIKFVMPAMKRKVLDGVVIVFSGVLPLSADIQNADISVWAKSFGATIEHEVRRKTTHLVAARTGTAKVRQALKRKVVKVVSTKWLLQCFSEWRKVDETPYLLEPRAPSSTQDSVKTKTSEEDFLRSFLSSSEDESDSDASREDGEDSDTDTNSRNDRKAAKRLKLDTDRLGDDDDLIRDAYDEEDGNAEHSPLNLDVDERNDIDQELKDFLGSDAESDSDTESVASSIKSGRMPTRKRKLEEMSASGQSKIESNLGPDDSSDPLFTSNVGRSGGVRDAIRPAAATAQDFNTVPAAVLDGQVPDNDETVKEQEQIEGEELQEAAEEEDSDDELARELERELEDDEDSDDAEDEVGGGGNAEEGGFMGASGGGGGGVNDIEEGEGEQSRDIEDWSRDLDEK